MTRSKFRSERGLALLLVISLLAMVTVLVVSLAVITRVETQINVGSTARAQAKHNAMLGLNVALGELQRQVGPDQRVTATAGATQSNAANPYWTGVWRTDGGVEVETWLVSGEGGDPGVALATGRTTIELVQPAEGALLNEGQVTVPAQLISSLDLPGFTGSWVTGAFAYFVADEGVKATLAAAHIPDPTLNDLVKQRLALSGGGQAVGFGKIAGFNQASTIVQDRLNTLLMPSQLSVLDDVLTLEDVREYHHDYTTLSHGLLVDPSRGRLKVDLSLLGDDAIPGLSAYGNLINSVRSDTLSPVYPIMGRDSVVQEVNPSVAPIITQIGFQFSVQSRTNVNRHLDIRSRLFIELANPYSSTLSAETLQVVISGLPGQIEVEARTLETDRDHGSIGIDLGAELETETTRSGKSAIRFELPIPNSQFPPGRVYNWRMPPRGALKDSPRLALDPDSVFRNGYWNLSTEVELPGPDNLTNDSEFRFIGAKQFRPVVELRSAKDKLLSRAILPAFDAIETIWRDASGSIPDFGFATRLYDRREDQNAAGDSDWIVARPEGDLRSVEVGEEMWIPTIDLESASYSEYFSRTDSSVEKQQLFNRSLETDDRYSHSFFNDDVALFELPRQKWLSVGSLQHLAFNDAPIYNVGNSWSKKNDWFDRYFFSGESEGRNYHQNLESIDSKNTSAHNRWVKGSFNLNSTSSIAWEAVLKGLGTGGAGLSLDYTTHNKTSGEVIGSAKYSVASPIPIARFPQSTGEMWELSPNKSHFQAGLRTYRRGLKSLTELQTQGLAERISKNIQTRHILSGPYKSVEEFLAPEVESFGGENLLEYSINEYDDSVLESKRINWDHYFPEDPIKIDRAAPMYLTSADMMTALAPMVNVRSDTFVIRAYGEVVDPVQESNFETSQPVVRAWLEAVVQRFPEGVTTADFVQSDPDVVQSGPEDWSQSVAEPTFGRQFRIVSFRWLTEGDL